MLTANEVVPPAAAAALAAAVAAAAQDGSPTMAPAAPMLPPPPAAVAAAAAANGMRPMNAADPSLLAGIPDGLRETNDAEIDMARNKVTFLVTLNKDDVQHLRNVGPTHGIHFLREHFPERFKNSAYVMEHPDKLQCVADYPPEEELDTLDPLELPPIDLQEHLIEFYFEYLRPFFPIMDRDQLNFYRRAESGERFFFEQHSLFAVAAQWIVRLGRPRPPGFQHPAIHVRKAKKLLHRTLSAAPSLSRTCGLMLLAMTEAPDGKGSAWALSGLAIRIAQDVGLHLDLARLPVKSFFSERQMHRVRTV
ncbi:hypothetical protein AMAG_10500, partial [Allomyces macrogynus ATCC 38327]